MSSIFLVAQMLVLCIQVLFVTYIVIGNKRGWPLPDWVFFIGVYLVIPNVLLLIMYEISI